MSSEAVASQPTTAVVRRRIRRGAEEQFERLMQEFVAFALRQPGHVGINVVRMSADSPEYTIFDRFATEQDRRAFTSSAEYRSWMQRLREVSEDEPDIEELGGLAFFFTLSGRPAVKPPSRPKMALITLVGVYPLSMLFPKLVQSLAPGWPSWLKGLTVAALMVASLTWVMMPALTRLFRSWLFPHHYGDHR